MSQKIGLHFQQNYNYEIPEDSNLEPGMKRIVLTFKVNKEGNFIDANARAEDEYLEAEAIRVAQLIPDLTPGYQRGKPVIVPFTLPLMVNLKANSKEGITKYPVFRGCDKTLTNEELESCSKVKIMNFIKMSFDVEMASQGVRKGLKKNTILTIRRKTQILNWIMFLL